MKIPELNVVKLRASILMSLPISSSEENRDRCSAVFEKGQIKAIESENGYWKLENEDIEIAFMNQRVDVVLNCSVDDSNIVPRFVHTVLKLADILSGIEGKNPLALSYSPVMAFDNSADFSNRDFFDTLLKVNRFSGAKPANSMVQCSYIVSRHLSAIDVEVNHVISFSEGTKTVKHDEKSTDYECLIVVMEINVPSRSGGYGPDDIKAFFGQTEMWRDELIQTYLDAL